jgi:hypothetical protein
MEGREEFQRPISVAQSFNAGPPNPVLPSLPHFSRLYAMGDGMRWEEPLRPNSRPEGTRGRTARKNDVKHKAIPKEFSSIQMSCIQRRNLRRAIKDRTEYLRQCWRPQSLHLPELELPAVLEPGVPAMLKFYENLWDWQDACRDAMRLFRDQEPSPDYDFSSTEIAFGGLARTESLRGEYYVACMAALQKRMRALDIAGPESESL